MIRRIAKAYATLEFIANHPLNRKGRVAALLRMLRWQGAQLLWPAPYIVTWLDGVQVAVRRGDHGMTQNVYCGLQDFRDMAFLILTLREKDTFVDVGANVGSYALLAAGVANSRVVALEPLRRAFDRLIFNVRINNLENRILAMNCGAGEAKGRLRFTDRFDACNRVCTEIDGDDGTEVDVIALDELSLEPPPFMLKIDTEGFELAVLRGSTNLLTQPSLKAILLETNGSGKRYGFSDLELWKLLAHADFRPYLFNPHGRNLCERDTPARVGNTLFLRDREIVQERIHSHKRFIIHGIEI